MTSDGQPQFGISVQRMLVAIFPRPEYRVSAEGLASIFLNSGVAFYRT